jgi:hypothetical protein
VRQRHRHLEWPGLDPLEAMLMALGGVPLTGITLSVLLDVVTRAIGRPWPWLPPVTAGCSPTASSSAWPLRPAVTTTSI